MKRRIFIIALAFAAVTAALGTAVASLTPPTFTVWVESDEGDPSTLKSTTVAISDAFNDGTITTGNITVTIFDTRINQNVTRRGRDNQGNLLRKAAAQSITAPSSVTIP